jgi:AraC family transcriptional regulator
MNATSIPSTPYRRGDSHPTVQEWFRFPAIRVQTSSQHLGWEMVHASIVDLLPLGDAYSSPIRQEVTLITGLRGYGRLWISAHSHGNQPQTAYFGPGDMSLVPNELDFRSRWDAHLQVLFLRFPSSVIQTTGEQHASGSQAIQHLHSQLSIRDPLLLQLGLALHRELLDGGPHGQLYTDALAQAAMLHILSHYSSARLRIPAAVGRLSFAQCRLLDAYIEANLHDTIRLATLASLLHLSVPHFDRLFRATYGAAPYQYVIARRVERAKALLGGRQHTLYEIAAACGFSNASQFARHFRARVGITPSQFRRHQRGHHKATV